MKQSVKITLVGVIVGAVALIAVFLILLPGVFRTTDGLRPRIYCAANLNSIGKQILIYQVEQEVFPLLYEWGDSGAAVSVKTQSDDIWDASALGTNAMQNVWLLIKFGCTDKMFECPSDDDYQARDDALPGNQTPEEYGWLDKRNYSYGLHKPYSDTEDATGPAANEAPLTREPEQGSFVIMADKNGRWRNRGTSRPGRVFWESRSNYNAPSNHDRDGFNCLSYQGSVKFHKCKMGTAAANSNAGVNDDDIYTVYGDNAVPVDASANPQFDYDTFIVPWD